MSTERLWVSAAAVAGTLVLLFSFSACADLGTARADDERDAAVQRAPRPEPELMPYLTPMPPARIPWSPDGAAR